MQDATAAAVLDENEEARDAKYDRHTRLTSSSSTYLRHYPLNDLPDAILLLIMSHLRLRELLALRRTNQELFLLTYDEGLFDGFHSLPSMQRLIVRPPSLKHLKGIFSREGPLSKLRSLDVTRMRTPVNALEIFPPAPYQQIRFLKILDQSMLYDMPGLEYLGKQVFGHASSTDTIEIAPRAGRVSVSMDRAGLEHLILWNRSMDALEQDAPVGFRLLGSNLAVPPLPGLVATRTSTSQQMDSPANSSTPHHLAGSSAPAASPSASGAATSTLYFDHVDLHLQMVSYYFTNLRSLVLPYANANFSNTGLTYLRYLPYLSTLVIGLRNLSEDLLLLSQNHTLTSLSFQVRSLLPTGVGGRSSAAAVNGTQRLLTTTHQYSTPEYLQQQVRRNRIEQLRTERRTIEERNRRALVQTSLDDINQELNQLTLGSEGSSEDDSPKLHPLDPFYLLSVHFTSLKSLSIQFTSHQSEQGIEDIRVESLACLSQLPSLTQLRLVKVSAVPSANSEEVNGRFGTVQRMFGVLRSAFDAIAGDDSSISPSPSSITAIHPAPPFRKLQHGSALSALHLCRNLRRLYLECWCFFQQSFSAWQQSPLTASLTSLTFRKCEFVFDALLALAQLPRIKYFEINQCRIATNHHQLTQQKKNYWQSKLEGEAEQEPSSLLGSFLFHLSKGLSSSQAKSSPMLEEFIVHQCTDQHGLDLLIADGCDSPYAASSPVNNDTTPTSFLEQMRRFPNLRKLFLSFTPLHAAAEFHEHLSRYQEIMNQHLRSLGYAMSNGICESLQSLTISNCAYTSERGWLEFANAIASPTSTSSVATDLNSSYPSLLHLDISACVGVTDAALQAIACSFPRLITIDISYSYRDLSKAPEGESGVQLEPGLSAQPESSPPLPTSSPSSNSTSQEMFTPPTFHEESQASKTPALSPASLSASEDVEQIDDPMCPYSSVGLFALIGGIPSLTLVRGICFSSQESMEFLSPDVVDKCRTLNPQCNLVVSLWQS